jgi:hypothetical protein
MVRISSPFDPQPEWHAVFLRMAGRIRKAARIAFRHWNPDAREEAVQAVLCNACAAVARLAELGKLDLCYASVLSRFSIAQVKDGRMTGGHLNCLDISSRYCQRLKDLVVERLDRREKDEENAWCEVLVEDRHAGPAETACSRIDFDAWLHALPRRDRKVAQFLSLGNRTSDAARKFKVSQGRISQLRRELQESWNAYTNGNEGNAA